MRSPVSVITGFLGSGKTTLLNRLLRHPAMADTAVVVNEFGEIGIDHLLVESAIEDAVLLKSGCICCTVRGDLVDTLGDLRERRDAGRLPPFGRVVVETTGLADPAPILRTLLNETALVAHYRLGAVLATVDAVNGAGQLDEFDEAMKQTALADRLAVTKTDLVAPAKVAALEARLRALNPGAPITRLPEATIEPAMLFPSDPYDSAAKGDAMTAWLNAPDDAHGHDDHDVNRHGADIRSFALTYETPLPWVAFKEWLESVASFRGPDLLRVKGLVNIAGEAGPIVIQGAQHVFHPPTRLAAWPDADRRTRLVFITRRLEKAPLERSLAAFLDRVG
jgi:G3E family GTPase